MEEDIIFTRASALKIKIGYFALMRTKHVLSRIFNSDYDYKTEWTLVSDLHPRDK